MSAIPMKRVVVAHPSALRNAAAAQATTVAPAQETAVAPAKAGAQSAAPDALGPGLRRDDGLSGGDIVPRRRKEAPQWLVTAIAMACGLAVFVAFWAFVAKFGRIPDPLSVFREAVKIFANPFYRNGPNDQGIGWNVLASLGRVGLGFGLAALVGIPLGFMIGRFRFLSDMAAPIIALLKPVSPLAWLPIGLLVFKAANPASIYVIFICSLWPMIVNTAVGVRQIPQDYLNVARVLNLS
ncbi:MAG TPA: ABC transporter permease subunit, partial [Usitatibacter sp.]|nr:ABC transporter permease subunit [Usitatibacter sp.]